MTHTNTALPPAVLPDVVTLVSTAPSTAKDIVRQVRLIKQHIHAGFSYQIGEILALHPSLADWLIEEGAAVALEAKLSTEAHPTLGAAALPTTSSSTSSAVLPTVSNKKE